MKRSTSLGPVGEVLTGASLASSATPVPFATTLQEAVAPGVTRRHGGWTTTSGQQNVEIVDISPMTPGISLEASYASGGGASLQRMSGQAAHVSVDGHRVVAAVNGDTWTQVANGLSAPTGLLVHGGEFISGTRSTRPTVGFDMAGASMTGDVAVTSSLILPDGVTTLTIDRVNKPRNPGELDLYTQRWGLSTGTDGDGTEVTLTGAALPLTVSGTWQATVAAVEPSVGDSIIPSGGLVLSAQGPDAAPLAALAVGQTVTITTAAPPGWSGIREAVSGREWLVRGGVAGVSPISTTTAGTHPRTAIGVRPDGSMMLVAVDGRQPGESYGVTADDLAAMLVGQGAQTAINLDGGGSTTELARRPGDVAATVVNSPSDGTERPVADGLLVISAFPTGALSQLVLQPGDTTTLIGRSIAFTAYGTDSALNAVPLPAVPVSWSMAGTGATLDAGGVLRTQSAGVAMVTAAADGLSGSAVVTILPDTIPPTRPTPSVRLRPGATVTATGTAVTVSWSASTDDASGVARYEVRRQGGDGTWAPMTLASPLARSVADRLIPGQAVEYEVRAVDVAGNASSWRLTGLFQIRQAAETAASFTKTWARRAGSVYVGGSMRASRTLGATATYAFTGSQIAWIAARGPTFGAATVLLDGVVVARVSLYATTFGAARVVYVHAWPAVGRHRITIRVLATSGHPWVGVDGFDVVDAASP